MLRYSFPILKYCFVKLFNLVLKTGDVPEIWCKGLITPVHNKGDPTNLDNYRPICVLSCLYKFFTNMLNSRLVEVCNKEKLTHVSQIGFKEGHRTTDHLFSLKTLINNITIGAQRGHNKLYACFIDFKKAYDSVWHDGLFSKLESLNITGNFLAIIKNMYKNSYCAVKAQTETNFFKCDKGVRQGWPT